MDEKQKRPTTSHNCKWCGNEFQASDLTAKTCSTRCRKAMWYASRKGGKKPAAGGGGPGGYLRAWVRLMGPGERP
jgi:hypothetical protein